LATLVTALIVILNIAKVVFGLGFVIFIHELGHFLAAKWNGVKVEKFFLGFDWPFGLRLCSFQYGETTYGIGAIPLGGYVKMLGESPEEDPERTTDPRAFSNKSVGARAVILSAGVVMNLILGFVLFSINQMIGVQERPPRLGMVQAGSPAYEAGLRPGDEIVSVNGKGDMHFQRLEMSIVLTPSNRELTLGVIRAPSKDPITIHVAPKRQEKSDRKTIGIVSCNDLILYKETPYDPPQGLEGTPPDPKSIPGGWKAVEAGPQGGSLAPLSDIFDLDRILVENRNRPIDIVFQAPNPSKDAATPEPKRVTFPVDRMLTFGLRLTPGAVESIQTGSIAEKAGFHKGDRIVEVEGNKDFDPMHLPYDLYERQGKPTTFVILRGDKTETLTATPDASLPGIEPVFGTLDPVDIVGLGMAIAVEPKIAAVLDKSPAANAGIKAGDTIKELIIPALKGDGPKAKTMRFLFGKAPSKDNGRSFYAMFRGFFQKDKDKKDEEVVEAAWPRAFELLQILSRRDYQIVLASGSSPITLTPAPDPEWANPSRGLIFRPAIRDVPPQPFVAALRRGAEETYDNVMAIYAVIRSLFQSDLSPKNLMGLPRIGGAAYQAASMGIVPLFHLIAVISINLAVINFLPIPPLDGGQIAFLLAEKIRGKPLPDTALVVFIIAGIVLVVGLMAFTIIQDIVLLILG
jgi:regulator of sigma E protease